MPLHKIGVRSVYRIPVREGEVSITNALLYSGNKPRDGVRAIGPDGYAGDFSDVRTVSVPIHPPR